MLATYSPKTQDLLQRLNAFFDQHIYPNEARHHAELDALRRAGDVWQPMALIDELKVKARAAGLWNM
ncbi:MAG: acyl-CoA dehydrogenase, partial [Rhodoferax sp.]